MTSPSKPATATATREGGSSTQGAAPPSSPVILIDTREPIERAYQWAGVLTRRVALSFGDYSVEGLTDVLSVERKTITDLVGSITRRRFWAELERARQVGCERFAVVIEGTPEDLTSDRVRSLLNPKSVMGALRKVEQEFGFEVRWAGHRAGAAAFTLEYLLTGYQALRG